MGVKKICKPKGCRAGPRCEHPWWFDVMHDGKRWRRGAAKGVQGRLSEAERPARMPDPPRQRDAGRWKTTRAT